MNNKHGRSQRGYASAAEMQEIAAHKRGPSIGRLDSVA
jgi:hypothetical protein